MSQETELRELVARLREQIAGLDQIDPELRSLLEAADKDIHEALGSAEPAPPTLVDRLRDAAGQFEDEHPSLTATLGGIAEALSRIGI